LAPTLFHLGQIRPYFNQSFADAQKYCDANFGGTEILPAVKSTIEKRLKDLFSKLYNPPPSELNDGDEDWDTVLDARRDSDDDELSLSLLLVTPAGKCSIHQDLIG